MENRLEKTIIFDADWIEGYCKLVGDTNRIHAREYMHHLRDKDENVVSKQVIVPGLMIVSAFGDGFLQRFKEGANFLDVHFGGFLCEEDRARLKINDDRVSVYNEDNSDVFYVKDRETGEEHYSRIFNNTNNFEFDGNFNPMELPVSFNEADEFRELMKINHKGIGNSLFGLSLVSRAVLEAVKTYHSEIEEELNEALKSGNLPVYTFLRAYFPSRESLGIEPGNLGFDLLAKKVDKRNYCFDVRCRQGNFFVYGTKMNIMLIPERVLVRSARYSTVDNSS